MLDSSTVTLFRVFPVLPDGEEQAYKHSSARIKTVKITAIF